MGGLAFRFTAAAVLMLAASAARPATYEYVAELQRRVSKPGSVMASGINWSCKATRCAVKGPWAKPGMIACRALSQAVGPLRSYGRKGAMLGPGEIAQCNKGAGKTASKPAGFPSRPPVVAPAQPGSPKRPRRSPGAAVAVPVPGVKAPTRAAPVPSPTILDARQSLVPLLQIRRAYSLTDGRGGLILKLEGSGFGSQADRRQVKLIGAAAYHLLPVSRWYDTRIEARMSGDAVLRSGRDPRATVAIVSQGGRQDLSNWAPLQPTTRDADGDGIDHASFGGGDCDDDDRRRFPGNVEICDPGHVDEDCDYATFGDRDYDGDGHIDAQCCNQGPSGSRCGDDCDDTRPDVHPRSPEVCDERDNDCDGHVDEGVGRLFYLDEDRDQYGRDDRTELRCFASAGWSEYAGDCDDTNPTVKPGAPELEDGLDNDCDGSVDEEPLYRRAPGG